MRERHYFYTKAKRFRNEDAWNIAKYFRNTVKSNIKSAKATFIKDQLNSNQKKTVKIYQIPYYINNFFIQVGSVPTPLATLTKIDADGGLEKLVLEKTTQARITTLIKQINTAKSSDIKDIKTYLIKDALSFLPRQLTWMINCSIETGIFPEGLKEAIVVPIPKTGNLKQIGNYRQISLLPLPGTILEKTVHQQIKFHLEEQDLLCEHQYGFRKKRSTLHAIAELTNDIYTDFNNRMKTVALFIDFRKAFDCVQYPILLQKLKTAALSEGSLKWVENYLSNRKQRTKENGQLSKTLSVKQGVPQGSILGPLLYILYANDMGANIKKCRATFYADDTVIYATNKSISKAMRRVQGHLNNLTSWCKRNGLSINSEKTKYVIFSNKSPYTHHEQTN